jgi:hypothetical protein
MENTRTQKTGALIFVIILLCIVEILFFYSNTFQVIKFLCIEFGAFAILYYLYLIVKVIREK